MLTYLIFAGFFLGILFGWLIGEPIIPVAEPMQDLFLRLLRMAILPLVITSIVSAVIQVGSSKGLGKISLRTITYYLTTSVLAILTGQVLVNVFKPGKGAKIGLLETPEGIGVVDQGFGDLLLNIIPENPFEAMANGDVLPVIFFSLLFGFFVYTTQGFPSRLDSQLSASQISKANSEEGYWEECLSWGEQDYDFSQKTFPLTT